MIVQLDKICKYYEIPERTNKRIVLKDVSLSINSGESIAIVGPSGSGKSTLLNIIGTLDKPSSGNVKFKGEIISSFNENKLANIRNQNIGFVFQMHHLLPQLNLLENILIPVLAEKNNNSANNAKKLAMELLNSVGLSDNIYQRPGQLSGGECQRAAVVRALINNPDLILADEPTGSLDQESAEQLSELLNKINKEHNTAMIVVTHSINLTKKMNKVYNLINGNLKNNT